MLLLLISCDNTTIPHNDENDICSEPPSYTVYIQPCDGITQDKAKRIATKFQNKLNNYAKYYNTEVSVLPGISIPDSFVYKPRNRYWAGKIVTHYNNNKYPTIILTNRDISTKIHNQYNYGILGMSKVNTNSGIVSTYRIKNEDKLIKVILHEFGHMQGLHHCKSKQCIMNSGNKVLRAEKLCPKCEQLFDTNFE